MANKRIKISELPKVVYDPQAVGTTTSVTSGDYMPIAVTDRVDATLKTTMAITTRELQRFVLGQAAAENFDNNVLKIGRGGDHRVEIATLSVADLTVTGTSIFEDAQYDNLSVNNNMTVGGSLRVGTSIFPQKLKDRVENTASRFYKENLIFTSIAGGVLDGTGVTLQTLAATSPIALSGNEDKLLSVDNTGKLKFSTSDLGSDLVGENALTADPRLIGLMLMVGTNGGLSYTTTASNSQGINIHVDNVADAVVSLGETIPTATTKDKQRLLTTTSLTPKLSADVDLAPDSIEINTTAAGLTANAVDHDNDDTGRVVFNSPIVLGTKHENEVDLTETFVSRFVDAQVGEIRWNIINNVPTIYLAVGKNTDSPASGVHACYWFGIPLFGTIDHGSSTNTNAVTAHSYEDED